MENTKSKAKSKTSEKAKKTTVATKTGRTANATSAKSGNREDEIRKKAQQIYTERIARGESGTAENDWLQAERMLKG